MVTANGGQRLNVCANNIGDEMVLELPDTIGYWQTSLAVMLTLKKGANTIRFWRDKPPQYGVAIKSFALQPAG